MFISKKRKHHGSSRTHEKPRQLFADYPYPILTELNKIYEQRKQPTHRRTILSSRWYRENFGKLITILHDRHNHGSSSVIIEKSLRSTHLNEHKLSKIKPAHVAEASSNSTVSPRISSEEINHNKNTDTISF